MRRSLPGKSRTESRTETQTEQQPVAPLADTSYGAPQVASAGSVGGVPGHQLPQVRGAELPVAPGDTLVLSTDGIRAGYLELLATGDPPNVIVERIMHEYGKGTDDALVLVARYLGAGS